MAVQTYYKGKDGSLTVGGTALPIKNWKVTHQVGEVDSTSTTSGGFGELTDAIETAEIQFEMHHVTTSSLSPYGAVGIAPGPHLTTTLVCSTGTGTAVPSWTFPSLFVKSIEHQLDVGDNTKLTVSARSHGTFTKPTA